MLPLDLLLEKEQVNGNEDLEIGRHKKLHVTHNSTSKKVVIDHQSIEINVMFSTARRKGLEGAIASSPISSIPSFLLPAFPLSSRSFSASTTRPSQIGRAPLSIPPEVNFSIVQPAPRKNARSTVAPLSIVHIEGPLGT